MTTYTDSMVAELSNNAPFDYSKAEIFAERYQISVRSVISKVKSLGLEYTPKAKASRKRADAGPNKAAVLSDLRAKLGLADRDGDLTKAELLVILASI